MFCSRPLGSAPEVTGPYCSQGRSGALPPDAWLSRVAFAPSICVAVLGSHCTVKPLCAASHWLVSFFRPALSEAVMEPVFGGSTALMTPELSPPEPPDDEHPAARPAASSTAATAGSRLAKGLVGIRSTPQ